MVSLCKRLNDVHGIENFGKYVDSLSLLEISESIHNFGDRGCRGQKRSRLGKI